jgi:protein-S-isoprenylcysteine O-methyltransferase Ste14
MRIFHNKTRRIATACFGIIVAALFLFTESTFLQGYGSRLACYSVGLLLVVAAVLGRLWSGIYIEGRKNKELIREGPYSVTRNPLYLFSFLGAFGLGLSSCNVLVLALLVAGFAVYYPRLIRREERKLEGKFGQAYTEYCRHVPRFWPSLGPVSQPRWIEVPPHRLLRNMMEVVWFVIGFIVVQIVVQLHIHDVLPALAFM